MLTRSDDDLNCSQVHFWRLFKWLVDPNPPPRGPKPDIRSYPGRLPFGDFVIS